jgi:urease accessory protein
LALGFERREARTVLAARRQDGPLAVQKPLYPEGGEVCHAIVVHPPAGIAGGDELLVSASIGLDACALLTTPGAAKWYRSAGPWARQKLAFEVAGILEWLPQETIVFDGALADVECEVNLDAEACYFGWEILCLGRTGSGERFGRGEIRLHARVSRGGKLLWYERGRIEGGGKLMHSPVGLGGRSVLGTMIAAAPAVDSASVASARRAAPEAAITLLPGLLVARYLGDSSEAAKRCLARVWSALRPALAGRAAVEPRIWRT